MSTYPIGVTQGLNTWRMQQHHVERMLDNAPSDNAHPDDTLLLAGPARRGVISTGVGGKRTLRALGMAQSFSLSSQASVMPLMAIGSGRSFFLRGKSQSQWTMSRVLMNGRNLLRALYHTAVQAGIRPSRFDDAAALESTQYPSQFFINLDSELFYIPIGMAMVMRTKAHALVGACYAELMMISSWGIQVQSGQAMIAESVQGLCDRVVAYLPSDDLGASVQVNRVAMDDVLGIGQDAFPPYSSTTIAEYDNQHTASAVPMVAT